MTKSPQADMMRRHAGFCGVPALLFISDKRTDRLKDPVLKTGGWNPELKHE